MAAIEQAIAASEREHSGEVRFAVEPALDTSALLAGESARERAIEVFSLLRLWDTDQRNGVLIYLLLADRDIEIVADRGVAAKVDASEWEAICREMEASLRSGDYGAAVVRGIEGRVPPVGAPFSAPGRRPQRASRPPGRALGYVHGRRVKRALTLPWR